MGSLMGMMEFGLIFVAAYAALATLIPFGIIYILGHVDGRRSGNRDAQLGPKVATTLLATISFQIALAGAAMLLSNVLADGHERITMTALGVLVGAGLAMILPLAVYRTKLAGRGSHNVGRKALGINAIWSGLACTGILVAMTTTLFSEKNIVAFIGMLAPYLAAATVTLLMTINAADDA
jgi:hypothetical protein